MSDNNNIDPTDPATLNFETMNASAKVVAHPQKPEPSNPSSPGPNFLSFSYYQKYFQVGQADVQRRLYKAFRIMDNDFLETEGSAPELWGPLWITLTLPVLLFISSMLSGKWAGSVHSGSLDYSLLTFGLFLFLFFATFEPLVMSYVIRRSFPTPNDPYMQYFEPIPLIMLTCYSWIILTVSFVHNLDFILCSCWPSFLVDGGTFLCST